MSLPARRRLLTGAAAAAALAVGLAVPASAHITGDTTSVAAGSYTAITLTVPHGCEESPTSAITVAIPDSVESAAPQVVAGWDVATETETVETDAGTDGATAESERVTAITWTAQAGNELPHDLRQVFTIGFQAPDDAGERLFFGVTQTCPDARVDWTEETGEGAEEPEHPAPFVDVTEADGNGHGGDAEPADEEAAAPATEPVVASTDDGTDGVAVAGVAVGALGLLVGGLALVRTRSA